jgi:hypothetical protein
MKRTSRKPSDLSESMHRQLNAYALAASAAGVGLLALVQPAEAKIVYTPAHERIYSGGSNQHNRIPLDLNHDKKADFSFVTNNTSNGTKGWGRVSLQPVGANGVEGAGYVYRLLKGKPINRSRLFHGSLVEACHWDEGSGSYCRGKWYGIVDRYVGFKFHIDGKVHYGWARLSVDAQYDALDSVTLTGYAYETIPNKSIIAGKTHEKDVITVQDATLGHLARGASAIPAWRAKESK